MGKAKCCAAVLAATILACSGSSPLSAPTCTGNIQSNSNPSVPGYQLTQQAMSSSGNIFTYSGRYGCFVMTGGMTNNSNSGQLCLPNNKHRSPWYTSMSADGTTAIFAIFGIPQYYSANWQYCYSKVMNMRQGTWDGVVCTSVSNPVAGSEGETIPSMYSQKGPVVADDGSLFAAMTNERMSRLCTYATSKMSEGTMDGVTCTLPLWNQTAGGRWPVSQIRMDGAGETIVFFTFFPKWQLCQLAPQKMVNNTNAGLTCVDIWESLPQMTYPEQLQISNDGTTIAFLLQQPHSVSSPRQFCKGTRSGSSSPFSLTCSKPIVIKGSEWVPYNQETLALSADGSTFTVIVLFPQHSAVCSADVSQIQSGTTAGVVCTGTSPVTEGMGRGQNGTSSISQDGKRMVWGTQSSICHVEVDSMMEGEWMGVNCTAKTGTSFSESLTSTQLSANGKQWLYTTYQKVCIGNWN